MATALPNVGKGARYGDLKRRLLFLLASLLVFRIGAHIPCPGIDPKKPKKEKKKAKPEAEEGAKGAEGAKA